jgi:hypothetical protein
MHLAELLRAISADVDAVIEADKQWKEMLDARNHRALDPGRHAGILRWLQSILSSASPIKIKIADLPTGDSARAAASNSGGTAATEKGGGGGGGGMENGADGAAAPVGCAVEGRDLGAGEGAGGESGGARVERLRQALRGSVRPQFEGWVGVEELVRSAAVIGLGLSEEEAEKILLRLGGTNSQKYYI